MLSGVPCVGLITLWFVFSLTSRFVCVVYLKYAVKQLSADSTRLLFKMKIEAACEAADAMVGPCVLESWNTMTSDIDDAASEVLGRGRHRQPD